MNTENISIKNIDYKELAQECKTQEDLAGLTKQFMKNMIENMLKAEIDECVENSKETSKNGVIIQHLTQYKSKHFLLKHFVDLEVMKYYFF